MCCFERLIFPCFRIHHTTTAPTGKQLPVHLNYTDGCWCEFVPSEVGPHVMTIEHCGRSISATPFFIKTYDTQKVSVLPTQYGCVSKPVQFVVDASNSGMDKKYSMQAKPKIDLSKFLFFRRRRQPRDSG